MTSRLALVIDDDPAQREWLERMLTASGWRVLTAADGQAGLDAVAAVRPDVVVLDVMMPRLNGYQVCRALRRDPASAGLPVVLLTSKSAATDQYWAGEVGASAFLTKPVELARLLETLERVTAAP